MVKRTPPPSISCKKSLFVPAEKLTIFAPEDAAVPEAADVTVDVLKYHVVASALKSTDIQNDQLLDTLYTYDTDKAYKVRLNKYENNPTVRMAEHFYCMIRCRLLFGWHRSCRNSETTWRPCVSTERIILSIIQGTVAWAHWWHLLGNKHEMLAVLEKKIKTETSKVPVYWNLKPNHTRADIKWTTNDMRGSRTMTERVGFVQEHAQFVAHFSSKGRSVQGKFTTNGWHQWKRTGSTPWLTEFLVLTYRKLSNNSSYSLATFLPLRCGSLRNVSFVTDIFGCQKKALMWWKICENTHIHAHNAHAGPVLLAGSAMPPWAVTTGR